MLDDRTYVDTLREPRSAEKVSGISGTLFLLSVIGEVVDVSNIRNPVHFGRYALTYSSHIHKVDEWIDIRACEAESRALLRRVEGEGIGFLEKIVRAVRSEGDAFKENIPMLADRIAVMTDAQLLEAYETMLSEYFRYYGLGAITFVYESVLSEMLTKSLAKKLDNSTQVIESLLKTEYTSFMLESENKLEKIVHASEKSKENLIEAYRREFYYIDASYNGAPFMTRDAVLQKIERFGRKKERNTSVQRRLDFDSSKLDAQDKAIIEIFKITELIRDIRKRTNLIGDYAMSRFMDDTTSDRAHRGGGK